MSKKERDIWDDAIRSKLEDFEMDTLPGDWEAIADRLPGKAPVPLRRTLRYWVAAAVISLLVVSGGIYLYDREMEDLPIAQEIQSSQESTSVDTPVVPVEKTMEQAPVLATIPAAAVVKAKAASGSSISTCFRSLSLICSSFLLQFTKLVNPLQMYTIMVNMSSYFCFCLTSW